MRDSPSWSPRFVDQLVGDHIHRELMDFTDKGPPRPESRAAPVGHPLPVRVRRRPAERPADIAKAESVKDQLMARDEVTRAAETAWRTLKRLVLEGVDDPSGAARAGRRPGGPGQGGPARRRRPARQGG